MIAPLVLSLLMTCAVTTASAAPDATTVTELSTIEQARALPTEAELSAARQREAAKATEAAANKRAEKTDKGNGKEKPGSNPPVPEPHTFALVGAALLMLAFLMRRREAEGDPQS